MSDVPLKGQILVATPTLLDPNFRRSVVLMLEHNDDGAVGIVLNRPSETPTAKAVPDLSKVVADGDPVFIGGPVSPGSVIALGEFFDPLAVQGAVCGAIGPIEFDEDIATLTDRVSRVRAFAGYSGWAPGQLEGEIEEEAWFIAPALPGDIYSAEPLHLWARVLERMGGPYKLVARMPDDPRMN